MIDRRQIDALLIVSQQFRAGNNTLEIARIMSRRFGQPVTEAQVYNNLTKALSPGTYVNSLPKALAE